MLTNQIPQKNNMDAVLEIIMNAFIGTFLFKMGSLALLILTFGKIRTGEGKHFVNAFALFLGFALLIALIATAIHFISAD
jgi:hypothetical protein